MRRQRPLILVAALTLVVGCREQPQAAVPRERCVELAREHLAEVRGQLRKTGWPDPKDIRAWFARESNDDSVPLFGFSELLKDKDAEVRGDAATLLGLLRDGRGRAALTATLADPDATVRLSACRALTFLGLDDAARNGLAKLRREDPVLSIRIEAAEILQEPTHADALTSFRLGLEGTDDRLRERCEDALHNAGKVTLPLPESAYKVASWHEYQEFKERQRVTRETRKDDVLYFEIYERVPVFVPGAECALGSARRWYRVQIEDNASPPKGK